jgi:hypothetical protein
MRRLPLPIPQWALRAFNRGPSLKIPSPLVQIGDKSITFKMAPVSQDGGVFVRALPLENSDDCGGAFTVGPMVAVSFKQSKVFEIPQWE